MSGFHYGMDMRDEARQHALEFLEILAWRDVEAVCSNAFTREGDQPFHFLVSVQQPNGKMLSACIDRYEDGRWDARTSAVKHGVFEDLAPVFDDEACNEGKEYEE